MSDKGWQGSADDIDNWWSDAPLTDRQLDVIKSDLNNEVMPEGWRPHPQIARKLVAEVDRLRAQLAEVGALGRIEYEIGIQQPGDDDAKQYCGFSEADVRARAAEQGATFVERVCRRGKWKAADGG